MDEIDEWFVGRAEFFGHNCQPLVCAVFRQAIYTAAQVF